MTRTAQLLIVVSLLAGCRERRSGPTEVEVYRLIDARKFSQALREGKKLVDGAPASAAAHQAYAVALGHVLRYEEALVELARARQLAPDDSVVAKEYAGTLAHCGRIGEARQVAADVAHRWPEEAKKLQPLIDKLDMQSRQSKNGSYPPGTAPAFVAHVADKVARGGVADVLQNDIEPALFPGLMPGQVADPAVFANVFAVGLDFADGATHFLGFEVLPDTHEQAGRTVVRVVVFTARTLASADIPEMETALANPAVKIPLYPFTVEMLRALDPADRHASLVAIAAHPPTIDMPIDVELSGGPGSWKVADLTLQDLRLSTEMKK